MDTPSTTGYTYDALDNLTSVTQGTQTRTFAYNSLSRLTSANNPESGTVTYKYDNNSNVISRTDARGITTTYAYDALNRLTGKTYSNGDPVVAYSYDQASFNGLAITNPIGRRTGMTDAAGSEAWSYDAMGRVLADQRTTNSVTKNTSYTYNKDGTVATMTYPSGKVITYSTGGADLPLSTVDTGSGINYALNALYAPQGGVASLLLGKGGSFSGIQWTGSYNSRLQPASIQAGAGSSTVLNLAYNFNLGTADNGNVAAITNNRDNTRTQIFMYDPLNRIQSAYTQVPTGNNAWGLAYNYDTLGNLLSATATQGNPPILSVSVNGNNQIVGYSYDAAGNLLHDFSLTYTYDAEGRQKTAAGATYLYDGDGKRASKSTGKLYWYGMNSAPLTETDSSGNNLVDYVFFGGKRIARNSSGTVDYYFGDYLLSARVVTNSSGAILDDCDFYPFGGERCAVGPTSGNAYQFTGQERDTETGNDHFPARYYENTIGRWLSPDPAGVKGIHLNDPQTWNMYAYTRNNPTTLTDPTGLYVCNGSKEQCGIIQGSLSAVVDAANRLKGGSKELQTLENILKFYGKEGQKNGVKVNFGNLHGTAEANTSTFSLFGHFRHTTITFDLNQMQADFSKGINGSSEQTEFAGTAAHEGTHGLDQWANGMPKTYNQFLETETNAFTTESYVNRALGANSSYGLWMTNWDPVKADALSKAAIDYEAQRAADCDFYNECY